MSDTDSDPPWESEILVSDAIGRLMEFWGFKRNMGRVWAMLYLAEEPLSSSDLQRLLQISSGAVSMTVTELSRWGVVKKLWVQGERRDFFSAERNLWKMVSHVLVERELALIAQTMEALEEALDKLRGRVRDGKGQERSRARHKRERVAELLNLSKLGHRMINSLVTKARMDAGPLSKFVLGSKT